MMAMHRLQDSVGQSASARAAEEEKAKLRGEVEQYKREAEEVSRCSENRARLMALPVLGKCGSSSEHCRKLRCGRLMGGIQFVTAWVHFQL